MKHGPGHRSSTCPTALSFVRIPKSALIVHFLDAFLLFELEACRVFALSQVKASELLLYSGLDFQLQAAYNTRLLGIARSVRVQAIAR